MPIATANTPVRATEPQDPMAMLRGLLASSPSTLAENAPKKEKKTDETGGMDIKGTPEEVMQNTMKAGYSQLLLQGILKGTDPQTIAGHAQEAAKAINSLVGAAPVQDMTGANKIDINKPQSEIEPSTTAEKQLGGKYQQIPASSPFGFGGAKMDEQGNLIEQKPGFVAGLLSTLVGGTPGVAAKLDMNKLEQVQKLTGEEPLQKSKIQEIGLEYDKAVKVEELKLLAARAAAGSLKPEHIYNGFEKASVPFITARDAHARVEESAKDPSAAGDLALIFNYMKVLDPGSTVREGEFAQAEQARGVPAAILNTYNKVIKGEKLGTKQRADFLDRSRRLFKGMHEQQKKTTAEFSRLAKENGVDFKKVIRDTGLAAMVEEAPKGTEKGEATVIKTGTLPDGTKVEKLSDGTIRKVK